MKAIKSFYINISVQYMFVAVSFENQYYYMYLRLGFFLAHLTTQIKACLLLDFYIFFAELNLFFISWRDVWSTCDFNTVKLEAPLYLLKIKIMFGHNDKRKVIQTC